MRSIILSALFATLVAGPVQAYDWCPEKDRLRLQAQTGVTTGPRLVDRHKCVRIEPTEGRHGRTAHTFSNTCGVWILVHSCFPTGTENYNLNFLACPKLIGEGATRVPTAQLERIFWLRPYERKFGPFAAGQIWWAVSCETE